ncbi:MAG: hypothetical protein ACM31C_04625 [Acidobacteriota bacterium]
MRKVAEFLVAASLAACAATTSAPGKGKGSGSAGCTVNCAGSFTLDDTGFIVQGDQWWSADSGPELTGTIDAAGGTLKAFTGDVALATATIANGTWSLQLPASTIPTTGVTVKLKLTAPGANPVEHDQLMSLDDGMPVVTSNSPFHDERGDTISFASGEAVHTHAGATIELGSSACPAVYKYTYLTDVTPRYASETSPNPLAWHISLASPVGIDDTGTSYRVRESATKTVLDWTPVSPEPDGSYTIALHRDGQHPIADLGTYDGMLYLDVQAKDGFGMTNVQTYCIDYFRIAPPLEIQQPGAEPTTAGESTLFGMTLAADSAISTVVNADGGPYVFSQRFLQHAAEPMTVSLSIPAPSGAYSLVSSDWDVKTSSGTGFSCGNSLTGRDTTDKRCSTLTKISKADTAYSGSLASGSWKLFVIDEATGKAATECTIGTGLTATCSIPARAAGDAPHAYRIVTSVGSVTDLAPRDSAGAALSGPFYESSLAQRTFTGIDAGAVSHCDRAYTTTANNTTYFWCDWSTYEHIHAIHSASIAFDAFEIDYGAKVVNGALGPVPYSHPQKSAALTWDAGSDKLPGE